MTNAAAHEWPIRVYYEDTDFAGVVYYANYLRFVERARTEWLRGLGVDQVALQRDAGLTFVVRRCEIDYLAPARFDDALIVRSTVARFGRASLILRQIVGREDVVLAEAMVRLACIDQEGRPRRMPQPMRALLDPDNG